MSREAGSARDANAWLAWAAAIMPALIVLTTLATVIGAYQAVPYQDQWANVIEYRELLKKGFSFDWLWRQHNEHRLVFPRLIFLADTVWAKGSNILNLAMIQAVQALGALLFARLALRDGRRGLAVAALALAISALFSLTQWENLVWGYQVQFVGVYACGGWALFLFCRSARDPGRIDWTAWLGAMGLLCVAAFTMANGVLVGGAMLVMALGARFPWRITAATFLAVAVLAGAYFHGYHPVEGHSPPSLAVHHPAAFIHYVLTYLGALFANSRPWVGLVCGAFGAGLTALMAYFVFVRRDDDVAQRTLLAIVLFVGLSAAATAFGRLVFGYQQAISSRYVTPSVWFWGAQMVFWARYAMAADRPRLRVGAGVAIGVAAFSIVLMQGRMAAVVHNWNAGVERASATLVAGIDDPAATAILFPNQDQLRDWAGFLRAQRLSIFARPEAAWIGERAPAVLNPAPQTACQGAFDDLTVRPGDAKAWSARGWAWDSKAHLPPRSVVLATADGEAVGVGELGDPRPDVMAAVGPVWLEGTGWRGVMRPDAEGPIRAYAVLRDGRACLIGERAAP